MTRVSNKPLLRRGKKCSAWHFIITLKLTPSLPCYQCHIKKTKTKHTKKYSLTTILYAPNPHKISSSANKTFLSTWPERKTRFHLKIMFKQSIFYCVTNDSMCQCLNVVIYVIKLSQFNLISWNYCRYNYVPLSASRVLNIHNFHIKNNVYSWINTRRVRQTWVIIMFLHSQEAQGH